MTTLSARLVEYLDHRHRFGYRSVGTTAAVLRRFATFADDFGAESITTELFLEWRKQFEAPSDVTWQPVEKVAESVVDADRGVS